MLAQRGARPPTRWNQVLSRVQTSSRTRASEGIFIVKQTSHDSTQEVFFFCTPTLSCIMIS